MLQKLKLTAVFLIILSIAMFVIGLNGFAGGNNWFGEDFAKFSFFAWFPFLVLGIGLYSYYRNKKRKFQR